jgi:putative ABC transport system permease protein
MDGLLNDFRLAGRMLRRSPSFSLTAVLVLVLGVGANTVIFSIVNGVLLRPLPYRDSSRLQFITEVVPKVSHLYPTVPATVPHFLEWRKRARTFDSMAAVYPVTMNLTGAGEPERLGGARVSSSFFPMLGVRPIVGRAFLDEEDRQGRDRVVLISDSLWERRFGRDPRILERPLLLDGTPYQIVGVLPAWFAFAREEQLHHFVQFEQRIDFWRPMAFTNDELAEDGNWDYGVIGRLAPGATREQALAELDVLQTDLGKAFPGGLELRASVTPLQEALVGKVRQGLLILLAAVGAVLLIVCVNVANLLLVRATSRERELAIRVAIGAGRARLLRQLLAESLTLAVVGGSLGLVVAAAVNGILISRVPVDLPRLEEVGMDWWVAAFAVGLSLLTGLIFWPIAGMALLGHRSARSLESQRPERYRERRRRQTSWRARLRRGGPERGSADRCRPAAPQLRSADGR